MYGSDMGSLTVSHTPSGSVDWERVGQQSTSGTDWKKGEYEITKGSETSFTVSSLNVLIQNVLIPFLVYKSRHLLNNCFYEANSYKFLVR